jgi:hypothetical protein
MPLPGNVTTITVNGTYLGPGGNPLSGAVTFTPNVPVLTDVAAPGFVVGATVTAPLTTAGHFTAVLPCTDNGALSPSGWVYAVSENIAGQPPRDFFVALPSTLGASVDLAAVVPVAPPPPTMSTLYGVLAGNNAWSGSNAFASSPAGPTPVGSGDLATKGYVDAHGSGVTFGGAGGSAVGDTAAAGTASTASHSDHVHGREGFGSVTVQTAFGSAAFGGVATTDARSDHAHGTPSLPDVGALKLGLVAQPFPVELVNHSDLGASSGFMIAMLIRPGKFTISNLGLWLGAAGATGTGVNAMALYPEDGSTQLAVTGDMTTLLTTGAAGSYVESAVTPYATADATNYYVALLCHCSVNPQIAGFLPTGGLSVPPIKGHRSCVELSGQASLPASWSPAGAILAPASYWLVAS